MSANGDLVLAALRAEQAAWRMDAKGEHLRAENILVAVRALIEAADEMYRISERKHDAWTAYAAARSRVTAELTRAK